MTNSNRTPNRLINEISPYLLQHAYNPVDWWPWCDEAFAKAKAEDKPVFLSIGYSTCHWCHVMERESFEDSQVAGRAKDFICIKVDKEERPDIDAVYMGVCQALTGSGGWPLTILMTPEQKPFFAGTYFPKRSRYGRPGLLELLKAVSEKWNSQPDELTSYGDKIAEAMAAGDKASANSRPGRESVETAALQLAGSFDKQYGGFGSPPKFPMPHNLLFLLRCHYLGVADGALDMVEHSLAAMYKGGIFDHVGGGFSRYSTDKKWLAPHFEKMLYDNALLVTALTEFYALTQKPLYKGIAEKTLDYIRREMTSPDGAFYSAQDADIDGEEGKFYTFHPEEVKKLLGDEDGNAFCNCYDITPAGNFEGKSIPNLLGNPDPGLPGGDMARILEKLYEYRKNRYSLHKDDKVLVSWNALMIAALSKAYRAFGTREYLDMATEAYSFIQKNMTAKDGSLFISYRNGIAKGKGLLDDYTFLSWACLELYESTFDAAYLERAVSLMEIVLTRFGSDSGGFYLSPKDGEALIFRPREQFDGAMPSGNSVAAWCLGRLAALTGEIRWRQAADNQLAFFGDMFSRQPTACTFALMALMQEVYPSQELVCLVRDDTDCLALEMGDFYHPQTSVLVKTAANGERLAKISPFTQSYSLKQGEKTAFYLCRNQSCLAPVDNIGQVKLMITEAART